jgi:hypothetical protein
MAADAVTVGATLQPDGVTLQLEKKLALPPGPVTVTVSVTVTVQAAAPAPGPTMLEVLDRIHRNQRQRGRRTMTEEEMAAEIARSREEDGGYEARWREIWSQAGTEGGKADEP